MRNKTFILPIIGLIITLIAGCVNNQSPVTEEIEFPNVVYTISPSADTTLFGPQGTRIFIGSETFQFSDGKPATDSITIELQEYYSKSDILLADLATVSNGQLLETAGMLHIEVSSGGKSLEIGPDKRIVVHFPKTRGDNRKMNLFYADETATETSVSNWEVDTIDLVKRTLRIGSYGWWRPSYDDTTSYNFIPKDFVDSGYFWNPLDFYLESFNFSERAKKEVESTLNQNDYPDFEYWNDYGVECEMKISTTGFIENAKVETKVSESTKKEILQFLTNLPQLEPGTNDKGEIIERRGLLFIQGGNIVPLYKTDEEYLKSFNSKYAKFENTPIKNMDVAEANYFLFSVSQLGWINCDRFIDAEETIDLIAQTPVDPNTKLKMVFSDIDGVLKANVIDGKYVFSKVPVGRYVTIVGIKNENGQFMTAFKETKITDKPLDELEYSAIKLAELRKKLESI